MNFRDLFIIAALISYLEASFRPPAPDESFDDVAATHAVYGQQDRFACVGALMKYKGGDEAPPCVSCTATLIDSHLIITCAHSVERAETAGIPLKFRLPKDHKSILSDYDEFSISRWFYPSDFRSKGSDIAIGVLESPVLDITPAKLGWITLEKLCERLKEDASAIEGLPPDERQSRLRYRFSSATFGEIGPWNTPMRSFRPSDGVRRGFNLYISSLPVGINASPRNFFGSHTCEIEHFGFDPAQDLMGGGAFGTSGAPLFIENIRTGQHPLLIGIECGAETLSEHNHVTSWSPVSAFPASLLREACGFDS